MHDTSPSSMTRRGFLKASAGAAAALAASDILLESTGTSFLEQANAAESATDEWVYSYCRNCISPYCGIKVRRRNGVAVEIEGDKDWPLSNGRLCPRGNANLDTIYNPYRVKAPMKRTNPEKAVDNDPGWVEISWDEAIDTVVEKLSAIRQDDPNKLVVARGFGAIWDDMPMFRPMFGVAFGTATATEINGPLCPFHYGPLVSMGSFTSACDLTHCNYVVKFGASYGGDFARSNAGANCLYTSTALLENAFERGMKMFNFDPHAGADTKNYGEWIPIKPGMDLPVVLAMTEVIMCEMDTYDEEFVKFRSNFPYLIKEDRNYLRSAEGKPMIWDATANKAMAFDDEALADPALEGSFTVDGATVRPAYDIMKEYVSTFTPEEAEKITGVSAERIRTITEGLVEAAQIGSTIEIDGFEFPYRPACVHYGRGATAHKGGLYFMLAVNAINALIGAIDVPGGMVGGDGFGEFLFPGPDGTVMPRMSVTSHASEWTDSEFAYPTKAFDLTEYYPHRHSTPHVAWRSIVDPEKYYMAQEAEAIWIWGANPFVNNVDRTQVVEAFKKVPFVIDIAYNFDETSQFADILLAESSPLERTGFAQVWAMDLEGGHRGCTGINFRSPVIDIMHNTRTGGSIIAEIAQKMEMTPQINGMFAAMAGIPDDAPVTTAGPQPHTFEEMCEILLQANYGTDKTLEDCLHNGTHFIVNKLPNKEAYNYYYYFPGRQTRVTVWDDNLFQSGLRIKAECDSHGITVPGWDMDDYLSYYQPFAQWIEHPEHKAPAEYDMFVVNWKVAGRAQAMGVVDSAVIRETQALTDPTIDAIVINTATARDKGLEEGDRILVESVFGTSLEGPVHLSNLIEPSCLGFAGNYGHVAPLMNEYARRGLNYNQLLNADEGNFDPTSGGMENTAACKITKIS